MFEYVIVVVAPGGGPHGTAGVIGPFPSEEAARALLRHWLKPGIGWTAHVHMLAPDFGPGVGSIRLPPRTT